MKLVLYLQVRSCPNGRGQICAAENGPVRLQSLPHAVGSPPSRVRKAIDIDVGATQYIVHHQPKPGALTLVQRRCDNSRRRRGSSWTLPLVFESLRRGPYRFSIGRKSGICNQLIKVRSVLAVCYFCNSDPTHIYRTPVVVVAGSYAHFSAHGLLKK